MRFPFLLVLLAAILFGSGYWYRIFDRACKVPIEYRVGTLDARFGTSEEGVTRIALNAERLWEDKLGKDLFVYDSEGELPINFVFDERQENANVEEELREDLEAKEGMNEGVGKKYDALIAEFRTLKQDYESRVVSYESKLGTYNDSVEAWNDRGGAPKNVIADFEEDARLLKREQDELERLSVTLNNLVTELNRLGSRANTLVKDYNTIVNEYNDRIEEAGEFTQGDYTGASIHIYTFNSEEELTIVLGHEFGHALSLGHVENEASIMYQRTGGQKVESGISVEDVAEFERVCKKESLFTALFSVITGMK